MIDREDVPLLSRYPSLVYLDSAATALKPSLVIERETAYSTHFTANIHRSNHLLADRATEEYESARSTVAAFLGVAPGEVIFTRNATESINLVAQGLPRLHATFASASEHHANLVPWMRRSPVHWVEQDPCKPISVERAEEAVSQSRGETTILVVAYASNVTGVVNPVSDLCQMAREYGVLTCVDASQAVAHLPINVAEIGCDFLVFSGHKLMGPTGIGVLAGREAMLQTLEPLVVGGGMIERVTTAGYTLKALPHRLEAGTPHISGAIGLGAAIDYLHRFSWHEIAQHEALLAAKMDAAFAQFPQCRVLMAREPHRLALGSIAFPGQPLDSMDIARMLSDQYDIMVRAGFHCAHPLFDGVDLHGALRISPYLYNTEADIDRLAIGLHIICDRFFR
jgi:cysteine desulfurase/selenocysteine lyase